MAPAPTKLAPMKHSRPRKLQEFNKQFWVYSYKIMLVFIFICNLESWLWVFNKLIITSTNNSSSKWITISEGNIPYHSSFSCEPIVFCIDMMLLFNDSWKKMSLYSALCIINLYFDSFFFFFFFFIIFWFLFNYSKITYYKGLFVLWDLTNMAHLNFGSRTY